LDYNRETAKQRIQQELGWRDYGSKHHESLYTKFFQNYLLPQKFGFDKRRAHLSTLVCSGQMTRNQAIQEMESPRYLESDLIIDKQYVLKKLGLQEDQFDELMRQPPKRHLEYPSHNLFFHELKALKRSFKRIATGV
jgi:hypothetical protein